MTTTYTLTQQIIDDAVELLVTSLHHIPAAEPELMVDTNAMIHLLRSLTPNSGEAVAIPADVQEAAKQMKGNGYRGALAMAAKVIDFVADYTHPAPSTKPAYLGPAKFTEQEAARGNVGIRWVTEDYVAGRPTDHDVREYLKETPTATGCACPECKAFYSAPSTNIVACPKCVETEVGTACSPTCGRRDDYAPSTKPAADRIADAGKTNGWELNRDEVERYVSRYGGMCRDCADENGICPNKGLPCDSGKAIKHVLSALDYGLKHGYITAAPQQQGVAN